MHRCILSRCFTACCSLPVFIGLLFIATQGHSGARDTLISLPEQLEEVKLEEVKPEKVELEPGAQPAPAPDGDLLGLKPLPGEDLPESGDLTEVPVDNAFVGPSPGDELPPEDIDPQLPTRIAMDDVLVDDLLSARPLGQDDILPGGPDAFQGLTVSRGAFGLRGLVQEGETFDSGFLRDQLLPSTPSPKRNPCRSMGD